MKKKINEIFFNSILTVIDATFIPLVMSAAINVQKVSNSVVEANASYYLSYSALIFCYSSIILTVAFLKVNAKTLEQKKNKKRCSYIYSEMRLPKNGSIISLLYPQLYQLRFIVFVYAVLYEYKNLLL